MSYRTLNPATEELLKTYPELVWERVEKRAKKAKQVSESWARTPLSRRRELFLKMAERLRAEKEKHAAVMTKEMGKPIVESENEIEKSV